MAQVSLSVSVSLPASPVLDLHGTHTPIIHTVRLLRAAPSSSPNLIPIQHRLRIEPYHDGHTARLAAVQSPIASPCTSLVPPSRFVTMSCYRELSFM